MSAVEGALLRVSLLVSRDAAWDLREVKEGEWEGWYPLPSPTGHPSPRDVGTRWVFDILVITRISGVR